MPKMSYNTLTANPPKGTTLGSRKESVLQESFASSPIYSKATSSPDGEGSIKLTDSDLKTWFIDHVVNGTVPQSEGYYGFDEAYNRDFVGAPDLTKVEVGAGGLPSTPYTPNPSSPGEGNGVNAESKPEAKKFAADVLAKKPSTPGSGAAANEDSRNPAFSSVAMKTTLGQVLGKSQASASKG